jgi:phage shock protein C
MNKSKDIQGKIRMEDYSMEPRKLYRSRKNRMICGVCGGVAEYFNIDPTLIRLVLAIFAFTGTGIFAYIVAAIIIPDEVSGY